jgi:UDP-glucose 4-epimerase
MKILITGSSGQIGTNLALRLLKENIEVFGVDRRANAWTNAFPTVIQDLAGIYSDFSDGIGELTYPNDIDLVVHLAANAKVHELVLKPARALKNITITFNVLEFCRSHSLPIIFSSSREVYGDIHRYVATHEADTHISFTESTYSASKIAGEALVYAYAKCYEIPYIVFRFSNVYGRYDNDIERMERVIPLFIKKISDDEPITVYGKDKTLDFTYVDDCVDGIYRGIKALSGGTVKNETINLAYGEGRTLLEMAGYIAETLEKKPSITVEPPRVGEVTHYIADISKAKQLLNYEPKVSLHEGIKKAIAWNKEWQNK